MGTVYFTMYAVFSWVVICCCSAVSSSMSCSQIDTALIIDISRIVAIIFAFSATRTVRACISQVVCSPTVKTGQYPFNVVLLLLGIRFLIPLCLLLGMKMLLIPLRLLIFVRLLFVRLLLADKIVFRGYSFVSQFPYYFFFEFDDLCSSFAYMLLEP